MKKSVLFFSSLLIVIFASAQSSNCPMPFVGTSQGVGNSSVVTIPLPVGISANDVLIAAVHSGWCSQASPVIPPQGWTLIANTSNTGSGCGASNTSVQLSTFYKVATANEPAAYIFTGTTSQQYVGSIVAYSGVDLQNPVHVFSSNGAQDSCQAIRATGVTTTVCTRLVAVFFGSVNNSASNLIPDPLLTERAEIGTTGNNPWGNENLMMADRLMSTPGASGGFVTSLWGCSGDGWVTGAQLIALECNLTTGLPSVQQTIFTIQPNPAQGMFQLNFGTAVSADCRIVNSLGQLVFAQQINAQVAEIDLSGEAAGVYFIQVKTSEGITTKKLILR